MPLPNIQSAIPKRRYKYGEFIITILADIASEDPISYLYIAAVLREGSNQPEVYITCESVKEENENTCRVRVLTETGEHIIGHNKQWRHEQTFCEYAIEGAQQMFNLSDEQVILISQ